MRLIYKFNDLAVIERVARVLKGSYIGANTLYKDAKNKSYYLVINKSSHTL